MLWVEKKINLDPLTTVTIVHYPKGYIRMTFKPTIYHPPINQHYPPPDIISIEFDVLFDFQLGIKLEIIIYRFFSILMILKSWKIFFYCKICIVEENL